MRNSRKATVSTDHITKVFSKLMLQGKIKAAVRWLSENAKGGILHPMEMVDSKVNGKVVKIPVWEALKNKHPNSRIPFISSLIPLGGITKL